MGLGSELVMCVFGKSEVTLVCRTPRRRDGRTARQFAPRQRSARSAARCSCSPITQAARVAKTPAGRVPHAADVEGAPSHHTSLTIEDGAANAAAQVGCGIGEFRTALTGGPAAGGPTQRQQQI